MNVTDTCDWQAGQVFTVPDGIGIFTLHHNADDILIAKIEEEEAEPVPSLILANGQTVTLSEIKTDFESFVSQNNQFL